MKNILILIITLLISISTFAQQGINYKAVIKDDLGNVIASQEIDVIFSILEITDTTTTLIYTEDHTDIMTDANGTIILNIGEGMAQDDFSNIDWGSNSHALKVEIDLENDGTFVDLGNTEFKVVPYALHALTSGDKVWESEVDNVHILLKNVGIGTNTPMERLEINDSAVAGIKLVVPTINDVSKIEFNNGSNSQGGEYSYFRIENRDDQLRFELDSDLQGPNGFEQKMTISRHGLALQNGSTINEFSNDSSLSGLSSVAVPTEIAVKNYVDNTVAASGPLAIGSISSNATINSGSGNYSVVWNNSAQFYEINIFGESYNTLEFTTVVTPATFIARTAITGGASSKLFVSIYNSAGVQTQGAFHFITYKN